MRSLQSALKKIQAQTAAQRQQDESKRSTAEEYMPRADGQQQGGDPGQVLVVPRLAEQVNDPDGQHAGQCRGQAGGKFVKPENGDRRHGDKTIERFVVVAEGLGEKGEELAVLVSPGCQDGIGVVTGGGFVGSEAVGDVGEKEYAQHGGQKQQQGRVAKRGRDGETSVGHRGLG